MGDGLTLWEPTLWAMGVGHALNFALQTIAHRGGLPHQQKPPPHAGPAIHHSIRPALQPKHDAHGLA